MRKKTFATIFVIFLASCGSVTQVLLIDDHFYSDLASENNRISGTLYLDLFNENLDTLSYDYYLTYLSKHEAPSAKGLTTMIRKADDHFFKTKKNAFLILLYYQDAGKIVGDNSGTAFIDTVIQLKQKEIIPHLRDVAGEMRF